MKKKKIKIVENYIVSFLILIISIGFGCAKSANEATLLNNLLKNGPNILYIELEKFDKENFNMSGKTILLNVKSGKKIELADYLEPRLYPKLFHHAEDIISFTSSFRQYGTFNLINIGSSTSKRISIKEKLHVGLYDSVFVQGFDVCDDSTIFLSYKYSFYKYNVNSDSLYIIKTLQDKYPASILYDKHHNRIYFTYKNPSPTDFREFLGIYYIGKNSIDYSGVPCDFFCNFSPDGNKIIFSEKYGKIGIYDINAKSVSHYDFTKFDNGIKAYSAYFLSNNILLFSSNTHDKPMEYNFYLYDLEKMKLIKKITDDNSTQKEDIYIYNSY